jgi:hypothetical protein
MVIKKDEELHTISSDWTSGLAFFAKQALLSYNRGTVGLRTLELLMV